MGKRVNLYLALSIFAIIPTLLVWAPFLLRIEKFWNIPIPNQGIATVVSNYDGPMFLVVAKTFYDKSLISQNFAFNLPTEYYAAHFPLYPALIRLFSPLMGYPYSMLFVTLASSVMANFFFYLLAKRHLESRDALWLTFVFSIFPAKWLIVKSIGSAEPLFVSLVIASIYFFDKKSYLPAGLFGALAQLTKPPAILLFIAYFLYLFTTGVKNLAAHSIFRPISLSPRVIKILFDISFIPASLLLLFLFYKIRMGDFFAYFHSGDNIHLFFPPFQIFNYSAPWVGTFWLEDVILIYLVGLTALVKLVETKKTAMAWFTGIFLTSLFFVSHRDLMRYALPILPFVYIAFSETITKNSFKLIMAILLIPVYIFSVVYISQNIAPISDWRPFL
jgi:Gpi18-like mannosyltransferase